MNTVNIKGKEYVEVNERIKYFRERFKGYALLSEMVSNENGICIIKSKIINSDGVEVANGYAYEKEGSTFINKTSYIENCETSSWGRCLANFGIGIDSSVASADEVENAIKQQGSDQKKKAEERDKYKKEFTIDNLYELLAVNNIEIIDFQEKLCITKENIKYLNRELSLNVIKIYKKCENNKISIDNYIKSIKIDNIPEDYKETIQLIKDLKGV